jgi:hypothetical protein
MVREHGQTRIVGIDKIQVQDGKITHFAFLPDVLDRETRAYYTSLGLFGTKLPPRTDQR